VGATAAAAAVATRMPLTEVVGNGILRLYYYYYYKARTRIHGDNGAIIYNMKRVIAVRERGFVVTEFLQM